VRRFPYARRVQEGKLTWLWTRAEAGLPLGWLLVGVMHHEVIKRWSPAAELSSRWRTDDDWVALAVEADGPGSASGSGSHPEQALANLAEELRLMRGDRNG
jgi:hypothetical protein